MLRLPTMRAQAADTIARAEREGLSYAGFLAELLLAECEDRDRGRAERRIRAAHFPREKSLREFEYTANPNVDPAVIHSLATCDWITKGYPLCLIGDSGTGKSHLLIGLGTAAAMAGDAGGHTGDSVGHPRPCRGQHASCAVSPWWLNRTPRLLPAGQFCHP
ncbi:hypothetical protein FNH08_01855 [Streptomyces spongiae]|uniref:IstB-like ATP-binding domain-containing protein n=1 Tax=Streptomyces spongiae TaxID=565072 RepID=A0A5N8X9V5_9ACTN|nr:hypothetical protein [Streptomyces spongiae]